MKILQLCVFTNLWDDTHQVTSIDIKNGRNVFDITIEEAKEYDLIISAPPCTQFSKSNAHRWEENPALYINIANKCLELSIQSGVNWILENPPGRIDKLIPLLSKYRITTWRDEDTNKEYVIYGNVIIIPPWRKRYGKLKIMRNKTKREEWRPALIKDIQNSLTSNQ